MPTSCPNNVANHVNGCTCRKRTSVQAEAAVGLTAAASPLPSPGAHSGKILDQPVETRTAHATTTNYVARPLTEESDIFAYGGSCAPGATVMSAAGVPEATFRYSGGAFGPHDQRLMQVRGAARSHAEGWDRVGAANSQWSDTYDRRPSRLSHTGPDNAEEVTRANTAARLVTADTLNDAVTAREALPRYGLRPSTRAAIRSADQAVADAVTAYRTAYSLE